jgi:hypothetical protein
MAIDLRTDNTFEKYGNTYTSFSGADIVATIGGVTVGALSALTWSVTREKAPIFTLGSPNPRSFSRGKRGIAGSMMFTTFDRPALYNVIAKNVNNDNFRIWTRNWNLLPNMNSNIAANISDISATDYGVTSALPYYADQIPPFDVTITFANEYGQAAVRAIYGVELINEGSGVSMDDITIEESMTYVAREVGPMVPTTRGFDETDGTIDSNVVSGFGLSSS